MPPIHVQKSLKSFYSGTLFISVYMKVIGTNFTLVAILIHVLTIDPKSIQFYLIFCASCRGLPVRFCINARICINFTSHLLRVKNRNETRDREGKGKQK